MSYSLENKCGVCRKRKTCADWKIIAGSITIIHSAPNGCGENSWHQGYGTVKHECGAFDDEMKTSSIVASCSGCGRSDLKLYPAKKQDGSECLSCIHCATIIKSGM